MTSVSSVDEETKAYLPLINTALSTPASLVTSTETLLEYLNTESSPSFSPTTPWTVYTGKVRDRYQQDPLKSEETKSDSSTHSKPVIMVASDRLSGFDRQLAKVPFKGQVLNMTSLWWFKKTESIIANHIISSPHPNVSICKRCQIFPVEFVVRGYITGSTGTSLWTNYNKGVRNYCGIDLPEGLKKNQKLWKTLITPTTKDAVHDEPISPEGIVSSGRMKQAQWEKCRDAAIQLFEFGQVEAAKRGLILVDTKYEFGIDKDGNILLCDEIHTPDSSRYWLKDTYQSNFDAGKEPDNIDKEFLRLWFKKRCNPYEDEVLPEADPKMVAELSRRYILLYRMITGEKFEVKPAPIDRPACEIIAKAL